MGSPGTGEGRLGKLRPRGGGESPGRASGPRKASPGRGPGQAETPRARILGGEAATKVGQVYCRARERGGPLLEIKATARPLLHGDAGFGSLGSLPTLCKKVLCGRGGQCHTPGGPSAGEGRDFLE